MEMNATGSVLDERPLPWVIALGISETSDIGNALRGLGGTVHFCQDLKSVRQADFDFLVSTLSPDEALKNNLRVLQFLDEGHAWAQVGVYENTRSHTLRLTQGERASLFDVEDAAVVRGLKPLIERTILRNLSPAAIYDVVVSRPTGYTGYDSTPREDIQFIPLVVERNGDALACIVRHKGGGEWWFLPAMTSGPTAWVEAAFRSWKDSHPEAFPVGSSEPEDTWLTFPERNAAAEIQRHMEETAKLLQAREAELEQLQNSARVLSELAQEKERRLLYAKGDVLVDAVCDALALLGFEVSDSDEVAALSGTAKREDLQIRLPSVSGWVCLAEVKGKSRGAAMRDVVQLAKAGAIYQSKNGDMPDAEWYIVNANNQQAPSERPVPLGTSLEDVEHHAKEDNLVVIDTRQLFILMREVESGSVEKSVAQKSLLEAEGIYRVPLDEGNA